MSYFIHLSLEVVNNVVLDMRYWLSVRSRRLDFGQVLFFFAFLFTKTKSAILTAQNWPIKDSLYAYCQKENFYLRDKREKSRVSCPFE